MRFSKEEKAMRLEEWRRSGKSAFAYAKECGLVPQTFARWTKADSAVKPGFVEVPLRALSTSKNQSEILIEKGDMKIHILMTLGCNGLRAVMEGLRSTL